MDHPVIYRKLGAIAHVSLNRPSARNALTPEMLCRLADAVIDFQNDDALRVLVLGAEGTQAFCAGGDLALTIPLFGGARAPADAWDRRVLEDPLVMPASSLRDYPLDKPVIAAINGACYAAGFEIMLGTDIRIAAEHATFCLPEVKRAVVPFAGSMVRLPRQVPHALAMELMLTGDPIDAHKALGMGLVNHVVPAGEVLPRAFAMAERMARNGPLAMRRLKQTVTAASGLPLEQGYLLENETKRIVLGSDDAREGPRAFMEKREPRYTGQ